MGKKNDKGIEKMPVYLKSEKYEKVPVYLN